MSEKHEWNAMAFSIESWNERRNLRFRYTSGLCALCHRIQISVEAILACHPARSTAWLDCHPKPCELWHIHTRSIESIAIRSCVQKQQTDCGYSVDFFLEFFFAVFCTSEPVRPLPQNSQKKKTRKGTAKARFWSDLTYIICLKFLVFSRLRSLSQSKKKERDWYGFIGISTSLGPESRSCKLL